MPDALEPRRNPDGARIFYTGTGTGGSQIWSIKPDGTDARQITQLASEAAGEVVSADGKYLVGFGAKGQEPGEFHTPHGLAMDSRGRLYVADTQNNRVQQFAP